MITEFTLDQERDGWGPPPEHPPFEELLKAKEDACNLCYLGFCKKNDHIIWGAIMHWNWDDIHSNIYLWCSVCSKNNHNTSDCKFKKAIEIEKEKFICSKCSRKFKPVFHYHGERCPLKWNNEWANNFEEIDF
ncbi:143_t:CDS:1 [Dentiscutata erythropus]|uniref:143_t:CDS:1 n=1 Tax=Dentiscutata erythropus TaxID=1348616 RepID=A0A9N9NCC4_9GLOM|nr:143_t:CDS:1 [Dentiscutata erythropus]